MLGIVKYKQIIVLYNKLNYEHIMSIGFKIKRIREIKGIKQDFIADRLGISQQAYSKIEQSENLDEHRLKQIAGILEIIPEAIQNLMKPQFLIILIIIAT